MLFMPPQSELKEIGGDTDGISEKNEASTSVATLKGKLSHVDDEHENEPNQDDEMINKLIVSVETNIIIIIIALLVTQHHKVIGKKVMLPNIHHCGMNCIQFYQLLNIGDSYN